MMNYLKSIACVFLCALLENGHARSPQSHDGPLEVYGRNMTTPQELKDEINRLAIEPILAALKRNAVGDREMTSLLSRIKITATPHFMRLPNAYSRRVASGVSVEIDGGWFVHMYSLSKFAAVYVIDPTSERDIVNRVSIKYGADLAAALLRDRDLPRFGAGFNVKEYVTDPLDQRNIYALATRIVDEAMAWTILHEIAHHILGHLIPGRYDDSITTSQRLELEADVWAYKKMVEIGIPHFGVYIFMQIMNAQAQIDSKIGLAYDETKDSHPSWASRIATLKVRYDPMKATTHGTFMNFNSMVGLPTVNGQLTIKLMNYTFPRDPVDTGCIAVVLLQDTSPDLAVSQKRGNSMHLLQAPAGQLIDVEILEPDRTISRIVTTVTDKASGKMTQGAFLAWEQPWALYGEMTKDGFRVGEVMITTAKSQLLSALKQTTDNPIVQRQALSVADQKLTANCEIGWQVGTGKLGISEGLRLSQLNEKQYMNNLKTILGDRNFVRLQSNVMALPMAQAAMHQLQKMLPALQPNTRLQQD